MDDGSPTPCAVTLCSALAAWNSGWAVCTRHGTGAGEELARLGTEFELLAAAPALGNRREGEPVHGGPLKSERSPVNLDVLVATDPRSLRRGEGDPDGNTAPAVLAWVLAVSEMIRTGRSLGGLTARTVTFTSARARIAAHLDWVLAQDWAGAFVFELTGHHRALARLNSSALPRPRRSACRGCGSVRSLSWDGTTASCAECGGSWSGLSVLRPSEAS